MIRLKTERDIQALAAGGVVLANILDELVSRAVPGVLPVDLNEHAMQRLKENHCTPSFLNYAPRQSDTPFPAALCVSVNDAVVHGLPNRVPLREGDVVGLDLGLIYEEKYYLDSARTVGVGAITAEAQRLLQVTREALGRGIAAAVPGNRVGDIGAAIQAYVEGKGYTVVRQLVGHGVGFAVHEDPPVPNFGKVDTGPLLEPGLVIAIEPMVTKGDPTITTSADNWTVVISSGELSAHEEHTIAILANGPKILTRFE